MVLDAVPPFQPDGAVAEARDHHGVLDGNRALVIIAVQRPCLHLPLVQLAAMQQVMEGMQAVIAGRADMAQSRFELFSALQRCAWAKGKGCRYVQSVISVPSSGICQPARSAALRSAESRSSAGLELLICRKIFLSMPRSASAAIAPLSPDIEICPMACPVLAPRPAAISSSSRHTVPSKNTSDAPARRCFSSGVTCAQAARKYRCLPLALSAMRRPSVSPAPSSPAGWAFPSRYQAPLPGTTNGTISMPDGEPSGNAGSNALSMAMDWRLTFVSLSTLKMLLAFRIPSTRECA